MIRGKKNFLPPCHLVLGLSIMFNLEESSIPRHANERGVRVYDDSDRRIESEIGSIASESVNAGDAQSDKNDIELEINEESDDAAEPNELQFPDTHVKIPVLSSQMSQMSVESSISRIAEEANDSAHEEENTIILPDAQQAPRKNRIISKANKVNKKKQAAQAKVDAEEKLQQQQENQKQQKSGLKRGQRSKLKKIKEKYKDQDEEEKLMRMGILKSAGITKCETSTGILGETEESESTPKPKQQQKPQHKSPEKIIAEDVEDTEQAAEEGEAEIEEEETLVGGGNDLELLNSLTGLPHELDELLFALPVVAPYNALQNYKYENTCISRYVHHLISITNILCFSL